MPATEKRTFTLPVEQSSFIDQLDQSGSSASAGGVVRVGLRALQERDEAVERWLRDEDAPVYDAMKADPSRGIPVEDAFAAVRAHHAARLKDAM
jgi:antitoxin ParD1/3/4